MWHVFAKSLILAVVVLGSIISTGCASIPVGHGVRMYAFGEPAQVIVTNNKLAEGDLLRNGVFVFTLSPGETRKVPLPYDMSNTILTFKAFAREAGEKKYLGQVSRSFTYSYGGSNHYQEWVINYVSPPR
jgi:hypothetical protein